MNEAMQPLILKMSISLDGFVGTQGGAVSPLIGLSDDASTEWEVDTLSQASAHLMGRKTFRDMAAWWPFSGELYAEPMNRIAKVVFTRSAGFDPAGDDRTTGALDSMADLQASLPPRREPDPATLAGWLKPEVLCGELARHIAELKQRNGNYLLAHGGAGFAQSLIATGEIDEYRLLVHPLALGQGLPLFAQLAAPLALELVNARTFPVGAIALTYRPRCT